ncbi:MAG: HAMP domain-containing protein [Clostridiales bacterium]|nr:MAG: HAMP domain-containing protein [Clostridiales bacterium]
MSDGVLDERLEINGHDEVARLGEAFNAMSDKLVMLEQKELIFVSSASHELRTPLSSIKLMSDSIAQKFRH